MESYKIYGLVSTPALGKIRATKVKRKISFLSFTSRSVDSREYHSIDDTERFPRYQLTPYSLPPKDTSVKFIIILHPEPEQLHLWRYMATSAHDNLRPVNPRQRAKY